MVDFPTAVAVPSTRDYAPPLMDFSWLANLPNTYRRGQMEQQQIDQNKLRLEQERRQLALSQTFQGGLPRNPDGTINYTAAADALARGGDINAITQLAPYQAPPASPLSSGVGLPQSLQPPYTSSGNLPPASVAAGRSTAPPNAAATSPAPPTQAPSVNPQGATVSGLVGSVLPGSDKAAAVAANIARALRVDPNGQLTPEQQTRAASLIQGYAQRTGVQPATPAAPATPAPSAGGTPDQGLQRLQSAIFGQESNYGRDSRTSVTGATGPMQIQPQTFAAYAEPGENIKDPIANQMVGNRILADYWKRYNGDAGRAAVAYFSGPGNVAPAGSPTPWKRDVADPTGKTVSSYVDDVQRRMGAGALRQATAPPPSSLINEAFQGFPTVNGQPIAPPPQPMQTALSAPPPQVPGAPPIVPAGGPVGGPAAPGQAPVALPVAPQPAPGAPVPPLGAAPAPPPPPAQGQAPGPIGPQVPLPRGYDDPGRAILALRQEAARYASMPNGRGMGAFFDQWASAIEKSVAPLEVRAGQTLLDPRTGRVVYQGPFANPNNIVMQRYLEEHPDATPEQLQAFQQSGRAGRSAISMFMNRYMQEHPEATADDVKRAAQQFTTQTTAQNRFLSGPQGNTIRSLNVVVSHLQTMQDLGNALKNGDIRVFNSLSQRWAEETGNPAPTNFDTAKQIVGAEVIKALGVAGAGTQSEREEAGNAFNRARSPAQLAGAIGAARQLLVGQLSGLRRQFVSSTGLPGSSFDEMLEPETRQFFGPGERREGGPSGGGGGSVAPPPGFKMVP